jgi:putative heme-binding domain-containing protein
MVCGLWTAESAAPLTAAKPPTRPPGVALEALKRLKGIDLEKNPAVRAALLRVLESTRGTAQFVEIVREFNLAGQEEALLDFATRHPDEQAAVDAVRFLFREGRESILASALRSEPKVARVTADLIGKVGEVKGVRLLTPLLADSSADLAVREDAVRALARIRNGAELLLELADQDRMPGELRLTASGSLHRAPWPDVRDQAEALLPFPRSIDAEPLPSISELVERKGDPARGARVFLRPEVVCATCHRIGEHGQDFGPNLSEIGTKLGKDALYTAILDPSAGISFGYEAWELNLNDGNEAFGLIVSETDDELTLKTQGGVVTRYRKSEIEKSVRQKLSIMPAGLQQTMTPQDLVDLVEYLASLKKSES